MSSAAPSIPPGHFKLTVDEYMELPNDGRRYQILDGDLDVSPAPTTMHQRVSRRIQYNLMTVLENAGLGEVFNAPTDVILDNTNVVQPDIVFVRHDNLDIVGEKNIRGVPDLMVEILSPSTRRTDVLTKSRIYASFRIPTYWIVDPDLDRIELYRLRETAYVLERTVSAPAVFRDEVLGVELPLAAVFA